MIGARPQRPIRSLIRKTAENLKCCRHFNVDPSATLHVADARESSAQVDFAAAMTLAVAVRADVSERGDKSIRDRCAVQNRLDVLRDHRNLIPVISLGCTGHERISTVTGIAPSPSFRSVIAAEAKACAAAASASF